jgi:U2 small nuclear ribonucleoprotein B''
MKRDRCPALFGMPWSIHKPFISFIMTSIASPSNTVYIKNIDWKIKKPLLRRALYSLFTRHGKVRYHVDRLGCITQSRRSFTTLRDIPLRLQVLEIITLRRDGLRGQAWIIFDDVQSATAALQAENGFTFFGKDLQLAYANEISDRIAKRNGTYVPKAKRKKVERSPADTPSITASVPANEVVEPSPKDEAEPSHILFAQDLPIECNEMMLAMLFRQYAGFQEVRIPRQGLGFIEFDDEPHATLALERLNGFKLTTSDTLKLTYGKS